MVDFDVLRKAGLDCEPVADCSDDGLQIGGNTRPMEVMAENARDEQVRMHSFRHWPPNWAQDLARFGFISISSSEQGSVRCVFCGLEIPDFSSPREAQLKHWQSARHYCPFLKGDDVGNVALNEHTRAHQAQASHNLEQSNHVRGMSNFPQLIEQTHLVGARPNPPENIYNHHHHAQTQTSSVPAVHHERQTYPQSAKTEVTRQESRLTVAWAEMVRTARYPHMAAFQARLETLSRWPLLKPSPTELAKAGFFHVKCSSDLCPQGDTLPTNSHSRVSSECQDSVKCFWCAERIHRWQKTDDAVLEHARLSPGCMYVTQVLGQEMHADIVKQLSGRWSQQQRFSPHEHTSRREQTTSGPTPMSSSQLDDVMQSPSVQRVLQMGFPRQLVRDLLSHNSSRLSADTLCHLALQAAEQASREPSSLPERNDESEPSERARQSACHYTRSTELEAGVGHSACPLQARMTESQSGKRCPESVISCGNAQRFGDRPGDGLRHVDSSHEPSRHGDSSHELSRHVLGGDLGPGALRHGDCSHEAPRNIPQDTISQELPRNISEGNLNHNQPRHYPRCDFTQEAPRDLPRDDLNHEQLRHYPRGDFTQQSPRDDLNHEQMRHTSGGDSNPEASRPLPRSDQVSSQPSVVDRGKCKVCAEEEVRVMFRPCNHLVCCQRCMSLFTCCPVCQQGIESIMMVYLT